MSIREQYKMAWNKAKKFQKYDIPTNAVIRLFYSECLSENIEFYVAESAWNSYCDSEFNDRKFIPDYKVKY